MPEFVGLIPKKLQTFPDSEIRLKVILCAGERHLMNKAIIRHSKHTFMKGKFCICNYISFHSKVIYSVVEGKVM